MRKGKKALDIIMSIVILFFSVIFYLAVYGPTYNYYNMAKTLIGFINSRTGYYIMTVLGGLLVIYAVFLFLRALISKTVLPSIKMEMEQGKVKITEESVESVVNTSLKKFPALRERESDVKLFGGKEPHIDIIISAAPGNEENLAELGEVIQKTVTADAEEFAGIPVRKAEVRFHESEETSKEQVEE